MQKMITDPHSIEYYKNTLPWKLAMRNLQINKPKTEEYIIKRKGDESWKDCKLLGSLLDTDNDIRRRKGLAIGAINTMKHLFYSNKIDIKTKMHVFNCYVSSTFLYNSELWTLTITKEKLIGSFHRRILRTSCLNIRWPKKVSKDEVYKRANTTPWSHQIKIRELKWLVWSSDETTGKHFGKNSLMTA